MGFEYKGVPYSPLLKKLVNGKINELGTTPLAEEQKLIDELIDYFCEYYKVPKGANMIDELHKAAEKSVYDAEAFYELNQLFSAFGHTSYPDVGKDRIKRLMIYKDRKR